MRSYYVLLVAFTAFCSWNGQGTLAVVRWDRQSALVNQGDELALTCTATGLTFLDVLRISRRDEGGTEVTIADNANVKPQFSRSSRLKVDFVLDQDGSATSVIQFQGVRGEDAGTIRCYRLGDESNSDVFNLTVNVPVESVKFSTISTDGNEMAVEGSEIVLIEGVLLGLVCTATVNGSLTSPTVTIFIDSEDKTRLFTSSEQSRIVESETSSGFFISEKKLRYDTQKPDPDWNDAELVCKAERFGFPEVTAAVSLKVQYRPVVKCLKSDEYAKIGQSVTFTCQVSANPGSTIVWTRNALERLTEDSNTIIVDKVIKPDVSEVSLSFPSVNESHFSTYTITARNDHGQDGVDIELHQLNDSSAKEDPSNSEENQQNDQNHAKYFVAQSESGDSRGGEISHSTLSSSVGMKISVLTWFGIVCSIFRQITDCI